MKKNIIPLIIAISGLILYVAGSHLDSQLDSKVMDQIQIELEQNSETNVPERWAILQDKNKPVHKRNKTIEIGGFVIAICGAITSRIIKKKEPKPDEKWI